MTVHVKIDGKALEAHQQWLALLSNPAHQRALLDIVGAVHTSQVKRRINDERRSPDGTPWAPWSAGYAATRHGNQSLLQSEGHLLDSIGFAVGKKNVQVGSALAYARTHQEGFDGSVSVPAHIRYIRSAFGKALKFPVAVNVTAFKRHLTVPKRAFLGLSESNRQDMLAVIGKFWQEKLT